MEYLLSYQISPWLNIVKTKIIRSK